MSPGNSYFKDAEVTHLLKETIARYGETAILVADIPAISTYLAYGYPENRARNKAIPKGNNLKNRTQRIAEELGISDKVRIIDWENEIENNPLYHPYYEAIQSLYNSNQAFQETADSTTQQVLELSSHEIPDIEKATKIAVHYLLSELAFLEFASEFLDKEQIVYVYHRNWPIYERYLSGSFDGKPKQHLDFLLLESPQETYRPQTSAEQMEHITTSKNLRCSFTNYPPGLIEDQNTGQFSGVFYDLITEYAAENGWGLEWVEETGYGVIAEGLNSGRFDIFIAPVWPTTERLTTLSFTTSVYTSAVGLWVRGDDLEQVQSPDIKNNSFFRVAVKEGDISESIANADYPIWRKVRVPQLTDTDELLRFVAQGDADATFAEPYLVELFNQISEVKLVNAARDPVRTFDNCFAIAQNSVELKDSLNHFIARKVEEGKVAELLNTYAKSWQEEGISLPKS